MLLLLGHHLFRSSSAILAAGQEPATTVTSLDGCYGAREKTGLQELSV